MFGFLIRKIVGAVLVMIGVLMVTFLLFRVAAGDPARAALGKNPSPKEVEDLRITLSSGKPLVWGWWRRTELYSSADFTSGRLPNGVTSSGDVSFKDEGLSLADGGELRFHRNFDAPDTAILARIVVDGAGLWMGRRFDTKGRWETLERSFGDGRGEEENVPPDEFAISAEANTNVLVASAEFYRKQESPWDSQLVAAGGEMVSLKSTFPYVSVFNFGRSLTTREPVSKVLARGVWPSLALMLPIVLGELLGGVVIAMIAAAFRGRWPDHLATLLSVVGMSVSYVIVLIAGQYVFAYWLGWFPIWGFESPWHLVLPVLLGVVSGLGGGVRFYRTVFVNELGREYLRAAVAKGCGGFSVYFRHLLRNAAVPIINRLSVIAPFMFTGSLLLESFFGIPGLGYAGINALRNSDLQMIKALVVATAGVFVFTNIVAETACAWADPRYRME